MRSSPVTIPHAIFLTLISVLCPLSTPALADHWPTRRYDSGRAATSPDVLPEKLFRLWEYDFYLNLDEAAPPEDGEPPAKKTPQELNNAITQSSLFFLETARPHPRANTVE